jgi:perosamine synthetase
MKGFEGRQNGYQENSKPYSELLITTVDNMIKLAKPNIPESAIANAVDVIKSGNLIQGLHVQTFENELEKYLNVKHTVLVSSGTAALHLALLALDIKKGDEVIVPAFTFPATANAVELTGAKPVLVDISLEDCCIDPSKIEAAITKSTKAIIPVHEFGQAAQMDKVISIARKNRLKIIEDAACALGAEFNGRKVGTFGDFGCFSFHPRKAITTGEGGAIVTNNVSLGKKVRCLRNHGIANNSGKLDFIYCGLNYRMTDFQAALGLPQLLQIEHGIQHRIACSDLYDKGLGGAGLIHLPTRYSNRRMVFQTYHIILDGSIDRDKVIELLREKGIETNLGAQALHYLAYYRKKYRYSKKDYPVALQANKQGLALPIGAHIQNNDIDFICKELQDIIKL